MVGGEQLLYDPVAPDYRQSALSQSLFDKLAPDSSISTFLDILTQIDNILPMLNTSQSDQPITVFCPVNAAFRNHVDGSLRANLETFLRNHIVPTGALDPTSLRRIGKLETMQQGETIQVKFHHFSGRTTLNGVATVDTKNPVKAVNGIAYKIDHMLYPAKV